MTIQTEQPAILVLNAGSSSVKFAVYALNETADLQCRYRGAADLKASPAALTVTEITAHTTTPWTSAAPKPAASPQEAAIHSIIDWVNQTIGLDRLVGVGHRVVHGGRRFAAPVSINADIMRELTELVPLAPLHQPHNLAAIEAVARTHPPVDQVACFDTAFHRAAPRLQQLFALPRALTEAGIIRYGFHGLSYEYICSTLPGYLGEKAAGRVVIAHLGNGASLCAIHHGQAVATTMSFTPLDGLVMGTRCGELDPGVIFYLARTHGMDLAQIEHMLWNESGLLGVSGASSDMRALMSQTNGAAQEAIALFCLRVNLELGKMAAALGGLDAVVFTGGIGEHAAPIRARIGQDAAWLGIKIDALKNDENASLISSQDSTASAWIIPTNEDWVIANHTAALLKPGELPVNHSS